MTSIQTNRYNSAPVVEAYILLTSATHMAVFNDLKKTMRCFMGLAAGPIGNGELQDMYEAHLLELSRKIVDDDANSRGESLLWGFTFIRHIELKKIVLRTEFEPGRYNDFIIELEG